ncbi:MAG: hypothetical protein JSU96_05830 [Acidobacteriota bacterium]|nr:MAG: hypothetical protein JSU96_05830 [Acidobacteriota bacterium]
MNKNVLAFVTILGLSSTGIVLGEEIAIKGHSVYTLEESERIEQDDGTVLVHETSRGFAVPETEPVQNEDCWGTRLMKSENNWTGGGFCVGVNTEGDMYWVWWKGNQDGETWGYLGGTGRFEGRSGGGDSRMIRTWADGKAAYSWDGTYEKK